MQILWWLAPPVAATVVAMLWVSWLGRSSRGEVDREVAVRRLAQALARPTRVSSRAASSRPPRARERSTGVAVRRPAARPAPPTPESRPESTGAESTRRAS